MAAFNFNIKFDNLEVSSKISPWTNLQKIFFSNSGNLNASFSSSFKTYMKNLKEFAFKTNGPIYAETLYTVYGRRFVNADSRPLKDVKRPELLAFFCTLLAMEHFSKLKTEKEIIKQIASRLAPKIRQKYSNHTFDEKFDETCMALFSHMHKPSSTTNRTRSLCDPNTPFLTRRARVKTMKETTTVHQLDPISPKTKYDNFITSTLMSRTNYEELIEYALSIGLNEIAQEILQETTAFLYYYLENGILPPPNDTIHLNRLPFFVMMAVGDGSETLSTFNRKNISVLFFNYSYVKKGNRYEVATTNSVEFPADKQYEEVFLSAFGHDDTDPTRLKLFDDENNSIICVSSSYASGNMQANSNSNFKFSELYSITTVSNISRYFNKAEITRSASLDEVFIFVCGRREKTRGLELNDDVNYLPDKFILEKNSLKKIYEKNSELISLLPAILARLKKSGINTTFNIKIEGNYIGFPQAEFPKVKKIDPSNVDYYKISHLSERRGQDFTNAQKDEFKKLRYSSLSLHLSVDPPVSELSILVSAFVSQRKSDLLSNSLKNIEDLDACLNNELASFSPNVLFYNNNGKADEFASHNFLLSVLRAFGLLYAFGSLLKQKTLYKHADAKKTINNQIVGLTYKINSKNIENIIVKNPSQKLNIFGYYITKEKNIEPFQKEITLNEIKCFLKHAKEFGDL